MKKNKLSVIFLILGILIILYPFISKILNQNNLNSVVSDYKQQIQKEDKEKIDKQKQEYDNYNKSLINNYKVDLLESGKLLGYIEINKINVNLPIYEGTDDKTLLKGIGHLEKTSLPTTNYAYHAIFVGHTGITSKKIFDDLPKLEIGDEFSVIILNERFNFRIYNIKKVLPNQTKDLKIKEDKKIVTLVTCIPKYVNSHRLLIMGENCP